MPSKRNIARTCEHCGKDFLAEKSEVKRGRAKYCSRACCLRHVAPMAKAAPRSQRVPDYGPGLKRCPRCKEIKAVEDFHNASERRDKKAPYCKTCHNRRVIAWQKENPK